MPKSTHTPDGSKVSLTHICDIHIPGLPTTLTGHIIPGITMASLIGIRILCNAGCKVVFDSENCKVFYTNKVTLRGYKEHTTNLWTLPIIQEEVAKTTPELFSLSPRSAHMMLSHHEEHTKGPIYHAMVPKQPPPCVKQDGCTKESTLSQPGPCKGCALCNPFVQTAGFFYTHTTMTNNFNLDTKACATHPLHCYSLAINAGFLTGAPHLNSHRVQKYLMASPATTKDHMKEPHKGIRSTIPKPANTP